MVAVLQALFVCDYQPVITSRYSLYADALDARSSAVRPAARSCPRAQVSAGTQVPPLSSVTSQMRRRGEEGSPRRGADGAGAAG